MKTKQEFNEYYNSLINSDEKLKEKAAKAPKAPGKKVGLVMIVPFVAVAIAMIATMSDPFGPIGMILPFIMIPAFVIPMIFLIIFVIIPSWRRGKVISEFEDKYKQKLVNYLLDGKKYIYHSEKYVESNVFSASDMYGYFNRYNGEDYTQILVPNEGNDFLITMSDLDVVKRTKDKDGNTKTTTIFNGLFGVVKFKRRFKLNIDVNTRTRRTNQKMSLESIEFEKKYKTYTNDQIEARIFLTPEKMDEIMKLNVKKPRGVKLSLRDNLLYFGFSGSHLFQTDIKKDGLTNINVDDFYNDVANLDKFIEEIKELLKEVE